MSDLISRNHFEERVRLAGGMADEELTDDFKDGVLAVLDMLKREPSVKPCDDAVSRRAVLGLIRRYENDWNSGVTDLRDWISGLPSVRPQESEA